jgi:hypothetical protein
MCAVKNCRMCETAPQLLVVASCNVSITSAANPNPVYSLIYMTVLFEDQHIAIDKLHP